MANKGKTGNLDSPEKAIRTRARNLPLGKCYVNKDWDTTKMANIVVTRKHVNGNITAGLYLVDLLCLGIKDSTFRFNLPEDEALNFIDADPNNPFVEIDYTLAHNIVYAGLEFADGLGFKPCREFAITQYILEADSDNIEIIEIECGHNDIPVVFATANDKNAKVIAHLNATLGAGNFEIHNLDEAGNDDDENDDEEYDDNGYLDFMNSVLKEFPDYKEIEDWDDADFEDFSKGIKNYPRFQQYEAVDALFLEVNPEFDYILDETTEYKMYWYLKINNDAVFAKYLNDEKAFQKYLETKNAISDNIANAGKLVEEAVKQWPDSIMIGYSKLTYFIKTNDSNTWNYIKELLAKFPDSLIIKNAAIGYALTNNMLDEAEKLIDKKYHPHHHYGDIEFSSIEVSNFYSGIAKYFALNGNLLEADIFIKLAEEAMDYDSRLSSEEGYIMAKELIMTEKNKALK